MRGRTRKKTSRGTLPSPCKYMYIYNVLYSNFLGRRDAIYRNSYDFEVAVYKPEVIYSCTMYEVLLYDLLIIEFFELLKTSEKTNNISNSVLSGYTSQFVRTPCLLCIVRVYRYTDCSAILKSYLFFFDRNTFSRIFI